MRLCMFVGVKDEVKGVKHHRQEESSERKCQRPFLEVNFTSPDKQTLGLAG